MTADSVIDIGQQALYLVVLLSAPMLLAALGVGLLIGMIQAATQINEMTLSFIPKLLALVIALFMAGPWMLELLIGFTRSLFEQLPGVLS